MKNVKVFLLLASIFLLDNNFSAAEAPCGTNCAVNYSGTMKICGQRERLCEQTNTWVTSSICTDPETDEDGLPCKIF